MSSDVGILNAGIAAEGGGDNVNNNDEGPITLTTRLDVHSALYDACYRGDCCASGIANGTSSNIPSLPTTLGLHIQGAGTIPLPMIDEKQGVSRYRTIRSYFFQIRGQRVMILLVANARVNNCL